MDVGALSYSTPPARAGQTGRSASAEAARPATGASEQASESVSAKPEGLYISPVLRYDQGARVAVLFFRDFDTGETRDQIPAERVVEQYRRSGGPQQTTEERQAAEGRDAGGGGYNGSSAGGEASVGGGARATGPSLGESFLAAGAQASSTSAPSGASGASGASAVPAAGTLVSFSI